MSCKWNHYDGKLCGNPKERRYTCWDKNCVDYEEVPPAPSQPCKWCGDDRACKASFVPKGSGWRCCHKNQDTCTHYKAAVAPAATGKVSGYKFKTTTYDDIHYEPLNKAQEAAMKRFMADGKRMANYDVVALQYKINNMMANMANSILPKLKTNKEDTMMSGNAYKCTSCRETFFRDEIHFMRALAFKVDRKIDKLEEDKFGFNSSDEVTICTACYVKYRKAVVKFNFPWDEWRKGDDDE